MSADKKVSSFNGLLGRGMTVSASVDISERVLQEVFGVSSELFDAQVRHAHRISSRIGRVTGYNSSVAHMLAAMFTSLGQDIACVHESALSRVDFVRRCDHVEGGITASLHMPSLVVGTVGGGTSLPTQRECLEIIDCSGIGKVRKLAEIICGYSLALELATFAEKIDQNFDDVI